MKLVLCNGKAFFVSGTIEKIEKNVTMHISNMNGDETDGFLRFFSYNVGVVEKLFKIENGLATISKDVLDIGDRYKVYLLSSGRESVYCGEFHIIEDPALGVCVLPVRGDAEHLWDCLTAITEFAQTLHEKLASHINGVDII